MKKTILLGMFFFPLLIRSALAFPVPSEEERQLDMLLSRFNSALNFAGLINPTAESSAEEKQKFFSMRKSGRLYEPQFRYRDLSPRAYACYMKTSQFKSGETAYSEFLDETREMLSVKLRLLYSRGKPMFTSIGRILYPLPSKEEIKAASDLLDTCSKEKFPEKDRTDQWMADQLGKNLSDSGLVGWKVVISENMSSSASVSPGGRKVNIRKGSFFSGSDIARLTVHEIGVHAKRAENGHAMPLKIFRIGLKDYLETEEGMAAYSEYKNSITSGLRLFALRVLAVDWASRYPFSAVFQKLCDRGASEELAWQLTQRVKRGMLDTSRPGCYPKDVSYFRGYLLISRIMSEKRYSWDDLMKFGKVSVMHIKRLLELEKVKSGSLGPDDSLDLQDGPVDE